MTEGAFSKVRANQADSLSYSMSKIRIPHAGFSPHKCTNVSMRKCILMIIKAGLDWDLISNAEIRDSTILGRHDHWNTELSVMESSLLTQKIIHIVLENSPHSAYESDSNKSDSFIVVEALETFVAEVCGSLEFKKEKVGGSGGRGWGAEGGWEVKLVFKIATFDIDTNNINENQINQYITDAREVNPWAIKRATTNKWDWMSRPPPSDADADDSDF